MNSFAREFERITGAPPPDGFGEPFFTAFSSLYNSGKSEVTIAAYTCSLFLSAIIAQFSTSRLHTFVHYIQENYSRFSFNCEMYDTIFARMQEEQLSEVILLNKNAQPETHRCSKEDVYDALDFYTNR